jgi:hypothetical protein
MAIFSSACNMHTLSGNDDGKGVWASLCSSIADAFNHESYKRGWYGRTENTSVCMYPEVFKHLGFKMTAPNPFMKSPGCLNVTQAC